MLPVTVGSVVISEVDAGSMALVMAHKGTRLRLPKAGTSGRVNGCKAWWFSDGQALVFGALDALEKASIVDQSDTWAHVRIEGVDVLDVLARLVPVDLRAVAKGGVVRTLVQHMTAVIVRDGDGFEILVMRSMAGTLVHELTLAARGVAGR
jgi:sarcosine oxidase subunit gamma